MIRKVSCLILLICLSGCIPKGFIITEETEEAVVGPQLTITVSPDPAPAGEMITITVASDKLLVNPPTVIVTQYYEKKGTDITPSLFTTDQLTWEGTYTVKPGYEGKALLEVSNALDEDGNKGYGTVSFEVIPAASEEQTAEETGEMEVSGEEEEIEYEEVSWYDIREEYGGGGAQAPVLTTQQGVSDNINCIAGDNESVWFGTNYGIGQYDRLTQSWKGFLNKNGGMSNSIHCMAMDDDIVWFGSRGGGLFRYQKSTDKWLAFPADNNCPDLNINDILIVNHLVWVATDRGLAKYDPSLKQWTAYTCQTTYNQLISEKITKIAWLYPYLWIGTDKGLMSYDPSLDVWQDQTAVCSRNITSLFMDRNNLWIGTPDSGLMQYNTTDNATRTYTVSNGLYSNSILSLTSDTNHVFAGHSGGVSKLDKSNDNWMSFTQTKIGDIIRSLDDVQAIYLEGDGNPWIGMNTGLVDVSQSQLLETIEPTIVELNPVIDTVLSTAYPEITARYEDNIGGSGIDPLAVWLWIDGVQVYGTITSGDLYYKPTSPLTEGEHNLEIQAADKCGNIASRKNTFSITLPKLSYKLLASQVYVKPGQRMSVIVEASEVIGTPTASVSFAEISTRFTDITGNTATLAAPTLENGTEITGTSTVFGSWTTMDQRKWLGIAVIPMNARGMGTVTVDNISGVGGQKPDGAKTGRVKVVSPDDAGTIAPIIPQITSIATDTTAGTIIRGTATPGSFVNLMVDGRMYTVPVDKAGNFVLKNVPIKAGTTTTTIKTSATNITKVSSGEAETIASPDLWVDFPRLVSTAIRIRGAANQPIGTISGSLVYGNDSVPLSMVVGSGGIGWAGSAGIPPGVDGMGTLIIVATGTSGQRAEFIGTLSIDTTPPGTPTIAVKRTAIGGWIIYGTATQADCVELWGGEGKMYGKVIPQSSGCFAFKADPQLIPSGTTILRAVGLDRAGNRVSSDPINIYPSLRLFIRLPLLVGTMLEVHGNANQSLGTISGSLVYDNGSVPLSMAVEAAETGGGMNWVGSADVPAGVDSVGTVAIVGTDSYNQRAEFVGTLSIDTVPPGTPTIAARYTIKNGWLVYGTTTEAALVALWADNGLVGTATPSADGAFKFTVGTVAATTTVQAISMDRAGNQTRSESLVIPAPLRIWGNLPDMVGRTFEVRGGANRPLGTINSWLVYGNGTITLSMAVDSGSVVVGNGGISWVGSASIPAGVDGAGTVAVVGTDVYNQRDVFIGTLSIDTVPPPQPIIAATYTAIAGWLVYGTATEAVSVELWTNNKEPVGTVTPSRSGTFTAKAPQQQIGTTTVRVISVDRAGNRTKPESLDIPAPLRLSANLPPLAAASLEVRGSANHALAAISGRLVYDTGSVTLSMAVGKDIVVTNGGMGWVGSASIPAGIDGVGTVAIVATDIYNQQDVFVGTLSIDNASPVFGVDYPTEWLLVKGGTVSVRFSGSDAATAVSGTPSVSIDGGVWAEAGVWTGTAGTYTTASLTDGEHTVRVRGTDTAGNVGCSRELHFKTDATSPTLSVTAVPSPASSSVRITVAASEEMTVVPVLSVTQAGTVTVVSMVLQPGFSRQYIGTYTVLSGGDGTCVITATGTDKADNGGNIGTGSGTFTADRTAPIGTVSIDSGATYTTSVSVSLSLEYSSDVSSLRFRNSGSEWTPWEGVGTVRSWLLALGIGGTRTVDIQMMDTAGNAATVSDSISYDAAIPVGTVSIDSGAVYATSSSVVLTLSYGNAGEVERIGLSNDGMSWTYIAGTPGTQSWTLEGSDGTRWVYFKITKPSGLEASYADSIVLDRQGPGCRILVNEDDLYTNEGTVTLTISASDPFSGMGSMSLSNNGATWSTWQAYQAGTLSWSLINGEVGSSDNGYRRVSVRFQDNAGNIAGTSTDRIMYDNTLPYGTVSINEGAAYSTSRQVRLSLEWADNAAGVELVRFGTSGTAFGAWEEITGLRVWQFGTDGTQAVYMQVQDRCGNVSGTVSDTITVDTTVPVISVSAPAASAVVQGTVSITFSVDQAIVGTPSISIDGGAWTEVSQYAAGQGTYTWNTTGVSDDSHIFRIRATDAAGNTGYSDTRLVVVGNARTPVTIVTPLPDAVISGSVTVKATAPYGSLRVEFEVGSGGTTYSLSGAAGTRTVDSDGGDGWVVVWPTGVFADGTHTLTACAYDINGEAGSDTINVVIDNTAPVVSVSAASPVSRLATITATSSSDTSQVVFECGSSLGTYTIGVDNSVPYSVIWDTYGLVDGTYTIRAVATDRVGLVGSSSATVFADNSVPVVSMISPVVDAIVRRTVAVSGTAVDSLAVSTLQVSIDGGTWTSLPYTWDTTGYADGAYILRLKGTDSVGNVGYSETRKVTVDNTAPIGELSAATYTNTGSVTLRLSYHDATTQVTGVNYSDGGSSWTGWVTPTATYSMTIGGGVRTVYYLLQDTAGNVSTVSTTITYDGTSPRGTVSIDSGAAYTASRFVTLRLEYSDEATGVDRVRYSNSGTFSGSEWEYANMVKQWELSAGDGVRIVYYEVRDGAGNVYGTSSSIILDTTSCGTLSVSSPAAGTTYRGNITLMAWAEDSNVVSRVEFYVDGVLYTSSSGSLFNATWSTTAANDGAHSVYFRAIDGAGNGTNSQMMNIVVDNTNPESVMIVQPQAAAHVSGTFNIEAAASDAIDVVRVEFYVDGTGTPMGSRTTSPWLMSTNSTTMSEGSHTLYARCIDGAGNSLDSVGVSIEVDNTQPVGAIKVAGLVRGVATVTYTSSSTDIERVVLEAAGVGGTYTIGVDTSSPFGIDWNTSGMSDGTYTVWATAVDEVGLSYATSGTSVVDNNPPVLVITSPAGSAVVSGTVSVAFWAQDGITGRIGTPTVIIAGVEYLASSWGTNSGMVYGTYIWNTASLNDGVYLVQVKGTDAAGNVGYSQMRSYETNNVVESLTLLIPAEGARVSGTVVCEAVAAGEVSSVVFACEYGGTWTTIGTDTSSSNGWTATWTTSTSGTYNVRAVSYGVAGGQLAIDTKYNVVVDNEAPSVGVSVAGIVGGSKVATVSATGVSSDVVQVIFEVVSNSGTYTIGMDATSPYEVYWNPAGMADGTVTVVATAIDLVGLRTQASTETMVDNTSPGTPTIAATYTTKDGWLVYGTATEADMVELWTNNKGLVGTVTPSRSGTFTIKSPQQQMGTTTVWVVSVDRAGNRARSKLLDIPEPLRLSAQLPPLVGSSLEVRGGANQPLATIIGKLVYDNGSVPLSMAVDVAETGGGMNWVGSASIPAGVDGAGTVSISAADIYSQRDVFAGTLSVDTVPPGTPSIAAAYTAKDGWLVYGTATGAVLVEMWTNNKGLVGTVTPSRSGTFTVKSPQQQVGTTTVWAVGIDRAGNWARSESLEIPAPLRLFANLPPLVASSLEVRGTASQPLGTISGKLVYDNGSIPLSMAVDVDNTDGIGWAGSATVPADIDGTGTLTIVATDKYSQQDVFTGTLSIDTVPPGTPTIEATYTATAGWIVSGTATEAVIVELLVNQQPKGTTTPTKDGAFSFTLGDVPGTATVLAKAVDRAGNRAISQPLGLQSPLQLSVNMPQLTGKMLEVYITASQSLGTISGRLEYDNGSILLDMTVIMDTGDMAWTGAASVPANVDGIGTLTIVATDIYSQQDKFIGTLSIDTVPPPQPIIEATYTATAGWIVSGTATEAVIVELLVNRQPYGTTTSLRDGAFSFTLGTVTGTITVEAKAIDRAGNWTLSQPPLQLEPTMPQRAPAQPTPAATAALVRSNDGGIITIPGRHGGQITLKIPPDALTDDSQITITEIAMTAAKLAIANFNAKRERNVSPLQDSCLSIFCNHQADTKPVSFTKQAMKLCIPYLDDNHDSIVDETNIRVETLRVFKLNQATNRWDMLTDSYPVAARGEVWANIYEFGIYAIIPYEPVYSLSDVRVYPNPFYPNMNQQCNFSPLPPGRLTINIYNSAGEQVRMLRRYSNEDIQWNGNNDSGDPVASGVYFYLIKNAEGKTTGKIGVIR